MRLLSRGSVRVSVVDDAIEMEYVDLNRAYMRFSGLGELPMLLAGGDQDYFGLLRVASFEVTTPQHLVYTSSALRVYEKKKLLVAKQVLIPGINISPPNQFHPDFSGVQQQKEGGPLPYLIANGYCVILTPNPAKKNMHLGPTTKDGPVLIAGEQLCREQLKMWRVPMTPDIEKILTGH